MQNPIVHFFYNPREWRAASDGAAGTWAGRPGTRKDSGVRTSEAADLAGFLRVELSEGRQTNCQKLQKGSAIVPDAISIFGQMVVPALRMRKRLFLAKLLPCKNVGWKPAVRLAWPRQGIAGGRLKSLTGWWSISPPAAMSLASTSKMRPTNSICPK